MVPASITSLTAQGAAGDRGAKQANSTWGRRAAGGCATLAEKGSQHGVHAPVCLRLPLQGGLQIWQLLGQWRLLQRDLADPQEVHVAGLVRQQVHGCEGSAAGAGRSANGRAVAFRRLAKLQTLERVGAAPPNSRPPPAAAA